MDRFCATIRPGEGRIALCLTEQLHQESKGNVEGKHWVILAHATGYLYFVHDAAGCFAPTGKKLTDDCKRELAMFKIERGANMNKNIPLGELSHLIIPSSGTLQVRTCCLFSKLRANVFRPLAAEACQADAKAIGEDSDPRDPGAVLACLRSAATGTWWISSTVPSYLSTVIKQLRSDSTLCSPSCALEEQPPMLTVTGKFSAQLARHLKTRGQICRALQGKGVQGVQGMHRRDFQDPGGGGTRLSDRR